MDDHLILGSGHVLYQHVDRQMVNELEAEGGKDAERTVLMAEQQQIDAFTGNQGLDVFEAVNTDNCAHLQGIVQSSTSRLSMALAAITSLDWRSLVCASLR